MNPIDETITVLALEGASYAENDIFARGDVAASRLFTGCSVSVDDVFNAV
ncbi:MAG: hypothetical protein HXY39_06305 [Chloroflexi bacterium]|nr:hypothetical protein [Chloroflexota bacterium]